MRRGAVIRLDFDQLAEALGIPAGVRIVAVSYDVSRDGVGFRLEGDALPLVRAGDLIPEFFGTATRRVSLEWTFD